MEPWYVVGGRSRKTRLRRSRIPSDIKRAVKEKDANIQKVLRSILQYLKKTPKQGRAPRFSNSQFRNQERMSKQQNEELEAFAKQATEDAIKQGLTEEEVTKLRDKAQSTKTYLIDLTNALQRNREKIAADAKRITEEAIKREQKALEEKDKALIALKKAQDEQRRITKELDDNERNRKELIRNMQVEKAEADKLKEKYEKAKAEVVAAANKNQSYRQKAAAALNSIREKLEKQKAEIKQSKDELEARKREGAKLKEQVDESNAEVKKLLAVKEQAEQQIAQLTADIDDKEGDIAAQKANIDYLNREKSRLAEENRNLKRSPQEIAEDAAASAAFVASRKEKKKENLKKRGAAIQEAIKKNKMLKDAKEYAPKIYDSPDDESASDILKGDESGQADDESEEEKTDESDAEGGRKADLTSNVQLDKYAKKFPGYVGAFKFNEIDDYAEDFLEPGTNSAIVLTDIDKRSGVGHWNLLLVENDLSNRRFNVYWYDPMGDEPADYIIKKLKEIVSSQPVKYEFKINRVKNQAADSDLCGYHCLAMLTALHAGHSWKAATRFQDDSEVEKIKPYFEI